MRNSHNSSIGVFICITFRLGARSFAFDWLMAQFQQGNLLKLSIIINPDSMKHPRGGLFYKKSKQSFSRMNYRAKRNLNHSRVHPGTLIQHNFQKNNKTINKELILCKFSSKTKRTKTEKILNLPCTNQRCWKTLIKFKVFSIDMKRLCSSDILK